MERHDLDPVALVLGATFVALGLAYLIGRWTWFDFESGWALAGLLVALGVAGIVTATRRSKAPSLSDQSIG